MKLLYFGSVRSRAGVAQETIETLPPEVSDVRGLIGWLSARGPNFAAAFRDLAELRVAVNQELTTLDAPVSAKDEVAVFPPMTGG